MDDRTLAKWLEDQKHKEVVEKFAVHVAANPDHYAKNNPYSANTQEPVVNTEYLNDITKTVYFDGQMNNPFGDALMGAPITGTYPPDYMETTPYYDQYTFPNTVIIPSVFSITDINTGKQVSDGGSSSYYELPQGVSELQDLIEHRNMNFAIGNIFKACYRMDAKEGIDAVYDLNKIIWYAEREKARIQKAIDNGNND